MKQDKGKRRGDRNGKDRHLKERLSDPENFLGTEPTVEMGVGFPKIELLLHAVSFD